MSIFFTQGVTEHNFSQNLSKSIQGFKSLSQLNVRAPQKIFEASPLSHGRSWIDHILYLQMTKHKFYAFLDFVTIIDLLPSPQRLFT